MLTSLLAVALFLTADPQPAESADAKPAPAKEAEAPKPDPPKLTEMEKIERLLQFVAASDVTFIRNGDEYKPKDAVEHMRNKLDYAGKRIKTARQFIKYIASESSMSGKPYYVRFKDGKKLKSAEWMTRALERIEAGLPPEEETKEATAPSEEKPDSE